MRSFDVIVIGTGGMGASAAMHLAARGARVCGLDRFPPGHDKGSSHGQTRLIRQAYFEHPDYVPLLRRAYELWRQLEASAGRTLLVESGLVLAGPQDGDAVRGTLHSATVHGLPVEPMSAREAMHRWPALQLPEDWSAVHEACGGYLFVEECVRACAAAAVRDGATLESDVAVQGWRVAPDGSHVVVDTDRERYRAERLVITAGAWAPDLLQLRTLPLRVLRKSLFWYEAGATALPGQRLAARHGHAAGALPCFAFDTPYGFFYGFPSIDERGVKVAEHTGGTLLDDPLRAPREIDPQERQRVERTIATHLPRLSGMLTTHATCLYTMSPDGHFVVGPHPDHSRVSIAAGFSGHGFKFASIMGEILADLALQGRATHPIGFLSPDRFVPGPRSTAAG